MCLVVFNYFAFFGDAVLEGNVEVEDTSASRSEVDKPPSTPDMSAHDAEAMVDSMLLDSPLPNLERGNEDVPEDDGSGKLPEEDARSFLREAVISSPERPLQVSF